MASCVTGAGYVRKATFLAGNSSSIRLVVFLGLVVPQWLVLLRGLVVLQGQVVLPGLLV